MAQQPSRNQSDEMNSESLESLWRQALLIRDFARDEIDATRRRRAEAEQARQQAEQDSIRATEELCADMRAEAQSDLEDAQATLEKARELQVHAESELDAARSIKAQAELTPESVMAKAPTRKSTRTTTEPEIEPEAVAKPKAKKASTAKTTKSRAKSGRYAKKAETTATVKAA